MNIFAPYPDPVKSANVLADRHIVKMPVETAQMMSSALDFLSKEAPKSLIPQFELDRLYKPTHVNHPSNKWLLKSAGNYEWLYLHGITLGERYKLIYNKNHASVDIIKRCFDIFSKPDISDWYFEYNEVDVTEFYPAMPDEFKVSKDAHTCYQKYLDNKYSNWHKSGILMFNRAKPLNWSGVKW